MGATVTFAADFSSFSDALDRATLKLKSFGTEPSKVEKALNRIGDAFSGQKIISEATLAARAIGDMGGTSKLTAQEQSRLNSIVTEAIAKYRALGQSAPQNLLDIEKATRKVEVQTTLSEKAAGLAKSTFGQMFSAFSAANLVDKAVGTLISFGKEAFNSAGRIVDLSAKLNISTDAIQRWEFVAGQTGATLEDFSSNAFKLGTRLAGGAGSVQQAVKDLGLSFQQLRTLKPEDQFDTVVSALSKMEDATKRNAIGVAIFGKGFEAIASSVAQGYADIAKGATLSTEAQLKALDDAGDEWDKFSGRVVKATQGAIASILSFSNRALAGILFEGNKKPTGDISGLLDPRLAQSMVPAALEDYVAQLKAAKDALAALSPETRKQIDAALELGVKTEDLATQYGISAEVLSLYKTLLKETKKEMTDAERATEAMWKATKAFLSEANNAEGLKRMNEDLEFLQSSASKATKELQKLAMTAKTGLVESQLWNQSLAGGPLTEMLMGKDVKPGAVTSQNLSKGFGETVGKNLQFGMKNAVGQMPDIMLQAFTGGGNVGKSVGALVGGSLAGSLGGTLTKSLTPVLGKTLGGALGGMLGPLGSLAGSLVGPAFEKLAGLFTGGEHARVNDMRDAAFEAAGGFESLNERAALAGISLDKVLATKKVKDFEAAMADVNKKISEQEAILQKYNVTWQDFSGEARVREFGKAMRDVVGDYEALTRAGLSHETAALKVKDAYIAFAKEAVKAGEEIPAAMAPVLKQLAEMGRLTEADAEALLGMAGDGLPAIGAMEDAAARYGIKLGDLGDRFASQKLFGAFEQIKADFDLLTQGGAGAGTVLEGMTDEMSKLLQQAIDLGATIPTSMKPILESLIEQGKLVDDSGHAFKDLSGVKFAEPLESAVGRLITKLDELIEKIGTTGDAFGDLPTALPDPTAGWGKSSDNYQGPETLPAYASGTRGRYLDFGAGTPVLLHGRERVMTEAEGRNTGGGALETIASALDGIDRRISTAVSRAVTDALILAPGWR